MPIEWHEESCKNVRKNYEVEFEHAKQVYKKIKEMKKSLLFYEFQVKEAKRLRKDGFDEDKFRKTKGATR